jgi:hypothetical protein
VVVELANQSPGAFGATWRDRDGEIVATTWGGTMCWFPRKGWRLRIAREGFEHVIRCGECPGCLEFERRRLADRLSAKYKVASSSRIGDRTGRNRPRGAARSGGSHDLFAVRVHAPLERHQELGARLHRRRHLELEPGLFRLGRGSFGILSRERDEIHQVLNRMKLQHRIEPVRFNRGRRAWRMLTSGLAVSRDAYGEQVKRWYARGLPAAEREKWEVVKVPSYKSYDRWRSPRAWKAGNLVLVPPSVWRMRRVDRVAMRKSMAMAGSPELAAAIATVIASSSITKPPSTTQLLPKPPKAAPSKELLTPASGAGGYVSSKHFSEELFPRGPTDEELLRPGPSGDPAWMERERAAASKADELKRQRGQRALDESLAIIERMRQLAEKRGRNG